MKAQNSSAPRAPAGTLQRVLASAANLVRQHLSFFLTTTWDVWLRFVRDNCALLAAAMAFYGLLSVVPLFLALLALGAHILGSSQKAFEGLEAVLALVVPYSSQKVADYLLTLAGDPSSRYSGWAGFFLMFWAGSRLFETLTRILDSVLATPSDTYSGHRRNYLERKGIALVAAVLSGLFFSASLLLPSLLTGLAQMEARLGGAPIKALRATLGLVEWGWPYVAAISVFFLVYKFMPSRSVPWQIAALSAVCAASVWEPFKALFHLFMTLVAGYSSLYGSIAGIVVLMVWIYTTTFILLLGAEVGAVFLERQEATSAGRRGFSDTRGF